jgi:hypothetical protein
MLTQRRNGATNRMTRERLACVALLRRCVRFLVVTKPLHPVSDSMERKLLFAFGNGQVLEESHVDSNN